jgi:transposase InsO family protein
MESRISYRNKELKIVNSMVQEIRREQPRVGTRKLYYLLRDSIKGAGIKMGRDALFSYLRSEDMLIKPLKNYITTTNSRHWLKKHPNLYPGVSLVRRPEEYFVSDITYIKSRQGTHYLSLVTDAYSRKIMGYELSNDMEAESVAKALQMAINNRTSNEDLIHHSDRGLQYASSLYQQLLAKHSIKPSMTDGYDCYQNALAERINGILKQEFLLYKCNTMKELELLVEQAINTYNSKRPHLSLNMKTPNFVHEKTEAEIHFGS